MLGTGSKKMAKGAKNGQRSCLEAGGRKGFARRLNGIAGGKQQLGSSSALFALK